MSFLQNEEELNLSEELQEEYLQRMISNLYEENQKKNQSLNQYKKNQNQKEAIKIELKFQQATQNNNVESIKMQELGLNKKVNGLNLKPQLFTKLNLITPIVPILGSSKKSQLVNQKQEQNNQRFSRQQQKILVQTFISTQNIANCREKLKHIYGKKSIYSPPSIQHKIKMIIQEIYQKIVQVHGDNKNIENLIQNWPAFKKMSWGKTARKSLIGLLKLRYSGMNTNAYTMNLINEINRLCVVEQQRFKKPRKISKLQEIKNRLTHTNQSFQQLKSYMQQQAGLNQNQKSGLSFYLNKMKWSLDIALSENH